jgi:hypothetical protein
MKAYRKVSLAQHVRELIYRASMRSFPIPVLPKWFDLLARGWHSQQHGISWDVETWKWRVNLGTHLHRGGAKPAFHTLDGGAFVKAKISLQNSGLESLPQHWNLLCSGTLRRFLNSTALRVLTMVYNAQNYWGLGLCPSSGILEAIKHVSGTRFVSVLRWGRRHLLYWVPSKDLISCTFNLLKPVLLLLLLLLLLLFYS